MLQFQFFNFHLTFSFYFIFSSFNIHIVLEDIFARLGPTADHTWAAVHHHMEIENTVNDFDRPFIKNSRPARRRKIASFGIDGARRTGAQDKWGGAV